jgi:DNA gyrase subunit B
MYLVLKFNYSTERPQFNEQQKLKLTSPSARAITSQAVGKMIIGKADIEAIVKKALIEKKAEDAAQRKREAERKVASGGKNMSMLRELPASFADSIDRNECELFIVEGKSAAGSAKMGRDEHKQAIFALRGKPLNTHSKELADIIKNEEIQNLLKILGCGIGEKFNIRNLRYDKIVCMADADADGGHINCLLTTLFLYHLPELIQAGKVYCAVPPLYRLTKGNDRVFTSDVALMQTYSSKKYEVQRIKGLGEMSSEELWDSTMNPKTRTLVQLTTDNMEEIISLYNTLMGSSSVNRKNFIVEHAREYKMVSDDVEYAEDSE